MILSKIKHMPHLLKIPSKSCDIVFLKDKGTMAVPVSLEFSISLEHKIKNAGRKCHP
jgi:hypothetical protein